MLQKVTNLCMPKLQMLRIPPGAPLGPPRRAMRAVKAIMDQNPNQIQAKSNQKQTKSSPNQARSNPNQNPGRNPDIDPRKS